MTLPYTLTSESLNVTYQGRSHTIRKGTPNFERARAAALAGDWDALVPLLSAGLTIERWLGGEFKIKDNLITYQGDPIDQALNQRMLRMATEGANPSSWLKFWERLQQNPSYRSVHQLYAFLARENIPIDDDGFIRAYKSVTHDYKDFHTHKIDNTPGVEVSMPRNKISDDPNLGCHEGLHIGALAYALSFGHDKRIVICRIDPADVVCVPYDASYQKMRVCRYTVIGNYSGVPLPSTTVSESAPSPVVKSVAIQADNAVVEAPVKAPAPAPVKAAPAPATKAPAAVKAPAAKAPPVKASPAKATKAPAPDNGKWEGNSALHFLLRPKTEGGWGLRQFEVIKGTGLDSGHLSRAARDAVILGPQAVARILAAFPDAFAPNYDAMDTTALMAVSEQDLRAYARDVLKIVGVSQITSKSFLVQRIIEVRHRKDTK